MAVELEFINLIVPIALIKQKYPGGWEQCLDDHANLIGGRVWYDEHPIYSEGSSITFLYHAQMQNKTTYTASRRKGSKRKA
jgi:hypothetical protein